MIDMFDAQEYAKTIAARIGYAVFAIVMIATIFALGELPAMQWWLMCIMFGFLAHSLAYAYIFAINAKETEQPTAEEKPRNTPIREQPKREPVQRVEQALQIETLELEEDLPPLPEYIQVVDKMIWGDRLNINGKLLEKPESWQDEWLYTVAEARQAGNMPTVSSRMLDALKIYRGNSNSPAALMIAILENSHCIVSRGNNQPYDWTDAGKRCFPSPTD